MNFCGQDEEFFNFRGSVDRLNDVWYVCNKESKGEQF